MIDLEKLFRPQPAQQPQVEVPAKMPGEGFEYTVPAPDNHTSPATHPSSTLHIHQWVEKLRSVAPPRRDISNLPQQSTPEVLEKALLGVLTVIYECGICKELYKTELLGSDKTELDDILDNVEKTGGQYYTRGQNTFVIQRYQPQQQPVTLR